MLSFPLFLVLSDNIHPSAKKSFHLDHHAAISLGTKIISVEGKNTKALLKWVVNITWILGCNPHKLKALWTIKLLREFPLGSLPQLVSGCSRQQAAWVMFSEHLSPALYNNLNRMWIQRPIINYATIRLAQAACLCGLLRSVLNTPWAGTWEHSRQERAWRAGW